MARLNPDYVAAVQEILKEKTPYFNLLGIELRELEPGRCLFGLETAKKHLQPFGVIHGGVLASILDAACFWSVFGSLAQDLSLTTTDLKINYLAPAPAGTSLKVTGESIKMGRTLCLAQAGAEDRESGRLIGFATSTLMIIDQPGQNGFSGLPEKFIV